MKVYVAETYSGERVIFLDKGILRGKDIKRLGEEYGWNGDLKSIEDVTEHYPINLETLYKTLIGDQTGKFGEFETEIIMRLVLNFYDNVKVDLTAIREKEIKQL